MPYTKFAVVIIGTALGFLFDAKMRKGNSILPVLANKNAKGWLVATLIWVLSIFVLAYSIILEYTINHSAATWSETQSLMFITFWRPMFCIACAGLVLPVFFGFGNTLRMLFGSFPLRVLGRLSYGAYLCFPLSMCFYYSVMPDSAMLYMAKTPILYATNIFSTFIFALFMFLLVEEPCRKAQLFAFGKLGWAGVPPLKQKNILYLENSDNLMKNVAFTLKGQ